MRILAFSDIHASDLAIKRLKEKITKYKPELLLNMGDFSIFDEGLELTLKKLDGLGVPMIVLHGNHETDTVVAYLCKKSKYLMYMHEDVKEVNGITFMAWGGGGFAQIEPEFESWVKKVDIHSIKKPIIFLTHAPPAKTKLDKIMRGYHVGCDSFRRYIAKHTNKIILGLSGHIHESFYTQDKIKETTVVNPGPTGTIIDVDVSGKVSLKFEK